MVRTADINWIVSKCLSRRGIIVRKELSLSMRLVTVEELYD